MTKVVTATQAKNTLGALIRQVSTEGETIVIENRREPAAILISPGDFEELQELRKERKRQQAIEAIRNIAARQAALNRDLSEEEADELVQRAIKDIRAMRRERAARSVQEAS
jgi:prevent-host-death family protein